MNYCQIKSRFDVLVSLLLLLKICQRKIITLRINVLLINKKCLEKNKKIYLSPSPPYGRNDYIATLHSGTTVRSS